MIGTSKITDSETNASFEIARFLKEENKTILELCDFYNIFRENKSKETERKHNKKLRQNILRKHEYHLDRYKNLVQTTGEKRLRLLRTTLNKLDGMGFMRSAHQREFHESFIGACLPQIYGKDLHRLLPQILRENNLEEIHQEIMVCCPRRWGKTMAVALFAAAYLWSQPDAEILIYSISKRTSTMLMAKVYNILMCLSGGPHVVRTHNQEELEIVNAHGGSSVCRCYPSSPKISNLFFF